jgi:hypothetical protein
MHGIFENEMLIVWVGISFLKMPLGFYVFEKLFQLDKKIIQTFSWKHKWVCNACTCHYWELDDNANIFLFQEGRFPLIKFNCKMETKRMKMHNFVSNKLLNFLLLSNITKETTKEIWYHKFELRSKRVPIKIHQMSNHGDLCNISHGKS